MTIRGVTSATPASSHRCGFASSFAQRKEKSVQQAVQADSGNGLSRPRLQEVVQRSCTVLRPQLGRCCVICRCYAFLSHQKWLVDNSRFQTPAQYKR